MPFVLERQTSAFQPADCSLSSVRIAAVKMAGRVFPPQLREVWKNRNLAGRWAVTFLSNKLTLDDQTVGCSPDRATEHQPSERGASTVFSRRPLIRHHPAHRENYTPAAQKTGGVVCGTNRQILSGFSKFKTRTIGGLCPIGT